MSPFGVGLCRERVHEWVTRDECASPSEVTGGLSAEIVLPSTTMRAGTTLDANVIVQNDTGGAVEAIGCGSLFVVALASDTYEPMVTWTMCAQGLTIPVGESTYPVIVSASHLTCGEGPGLPACVDGQQLPALPPGDYQARLYQDPVTVPDPPPIDVVVTP